MAPHGSRMSSALGVLALTVFFLAMIFDPHVTSLMQGPFTADALSTGTSKEDFELEACVPYPIRYVRKIGALSSAASPLFGPSK